MEQFFLDNSKFLYNRSILRLYPFIVKFNFSHSKRFASSGFLSISTVMDKSSKRVRCFSKILRKTEPAQPTIEVIINSNGLNTSFSYLDIYSSQLLNTVINLFSI